MTPELLGRLSAPLPVIRFIEETMRFYFEVNRDRGLGYRAYLHDPLAAAVALDPQLVVTQTATVEIDLKDNRGMTAADWSGSRKPNAQLGVDVNTVTFFDRFINRVALFASRDAPRKRL